MQLIEHRTGNYHAIRRVAGDGIQIDEQLYRSSLILGARYLDDSWPVRSLADLDEQRIRPLLQLQPELVLIGFGDRQQFPPQSIQHCFINAGIGFECMTLAAACSTFNILMSENRRALAGLILP